MKIKDNFRKNMRFKGILIACGLYLTLAGILLSAAGVLETIIGVPLIAIGVAFIIRYKEFNEAIITVAYRKDTRNY